MCGLSLPYNFCVLMTLNLWIRTSECVRDICIHAPTPPATGNRQKRTQMMFNRKLEHLFVEGDDFVVREEAMNTKVLMNREIARPDLIMWQGIAFSPKSRETASIN